MLHLFEKKKKVTQQEKEQHSKGQVFFHLTHKNGLHGEWLEAEDSPALGKGLQKFPSWLQQL